MEEGIAIRAVDGCGKICVEMNATANRIDGEIRRIGLTVDIETVEGAVVVTRGGRACRRCPERDSSRRWRIDTRQKPEYLQVHRYSTAKRPVVAISPVGLALVRLPRNRKAQARRR
jgi:hypothetical protein